MKLDRTQITYLVLIGLVVVAGIVSILYLLGVIHTGSDDGSPQSSVIESLASEVCSSISTYVDDASGGAADIVAFDNAKTRFGQLVGGSNAGSFLAFFDDDEEKSGNPTYTFFARNFDGNYVQYASSVLTWALPGESDSVSPIFSTDPRYIIFSANGTNKAELQVTFVQPVWCVALQRVDLVGRQIKAVAWLGARLEFIILLDGGELRHYTQEVTHHWVVNHTFADVGDSDVVTTSENRIFHCNADNTAVVEQLYDAGSNSWSVVGLPIGSNNTITRISASVDALWLTVQLSTGVVNNYLRDSVSDTAFTQVAGSIAGNGPISHYLNTRLVVANNNTVQSYVRGGNTLVAEEEPIQLSENILNDFVVTQLAVKDATNLVVPSNAGMPKVFKATCT